MAADAIPTALKAVVPGNPTSRRVGGAMGGIGPRVPAEGGLNHPTRTPSGRVVKSSAAPARRGTEGRRPAGTSRASLCADPAECRDSDED
ncbi:hypothetical protein [Saccharothrix syringae]|uniref:Uncharacterized protein n=1 Tax=Saccharothrix syringae TaxID=103733 RepID=A0A5Q0GZX4_SACSY|nr:hypothetical protein [Saccharothrix syringae]QFZ19403.1 hypothetical protein EKG83_19930 [Saccharothrix syringae]